MLLLSATGGRWRCPRAERHTLKSSGDVDLGLRSAATHGRDVEWLPWKTFERAVIAPRGMRLGKGKDLALGDLRGHRFVMPWPRSTTRSIVERALRAEGVEVDVALEIGGWEIVKRYVATGLGIAVVPQP
jgi:DNA-binding transcriptional LysR family regulator